MVAAISDARPKSPNQLRGRGGDGSNIMFNLQHDIGKWCTEYTWSAEDGMWGMRVLHNFGRLGMPAEVVDESNSPSGSRLGVKRVDEEDAVEGGLKGRVSIGAEFYFSAKEKSAGGQSHNVLFSVRFLEGFVSVSTGIRFTTLPDATPPSFQIPSLSSPTSLSTGSKGLQPQPPTTVTALFNPMLGHMSGAYTAQVSRDLSLSSRFDFNMYSYESEWTMGAEWWMRRSRSTDPEAEPSLQSTPLNYEGVHGVVKARASTNNVSPLNSSCLLCQLKMTLILGCFVNVGGAIAKHAC